MPLGLENPLSKVITHINCLFTTLSPVEGLGKGIPVDIKVEICGLCRRKGIGLPAVLRNVLAARVRGEPCWVAPQSVFTGHPHSPIPRQPRFPPILVFLRILFAAVKEHVL